MELKHCPLDELLDKDFHLFTYDEKCKLKNKKQITMQFIYIFSVVQTK